MSGLLEQYRTDAQANGFRGVSYTYFHKTFHAMNLSIFVPRKDQCDICTGARHGNISPSELAEHVKAKDAARAEKHTDKENANSQTSVWTMDCQVVLQCPKTQSSAMYYKTKLQVHNFTLYNMETMEGYCYLWDETEGDLSSDMFAYLQFHHFHEYIDRHPEIYTLIIWSDGCLYQNRCSTVANDYFHLSRLTNKCIQQKYLVRGHTQSVTRCIA